MESDLNPLSSSNILIKYADDTNLLVPGHTKSTLTEEFTHICHWAQQNKMRNYIIKTKELVFNRPHPTKFAIAQEHVAKLLGVFFIRLALRTMWIFCWLYVVNVYTWWNCWEAKIKAYHPSSCRLLYLLSWYSHVLHMLSQSGHLTNQQRQRINAFLKRARKFGFTETLYCIDRRLIREVWH